MRSSVAWLLCGGWLSACASGAPPRSQGLLQQALERHGLAVDTETRLEGHGLIRRRVSSGEFAGTFRLWLEGDDRLRRDEEFYGQRCTVVRLGAALWGAGAEPLLDAERPALAASLLTLTRLVANRAASRWMRFEHEPAVTTALRHPRLGTVRCWFAPDGSLLGFEFRQRGHRILLSFALERRSGSLRLPRHYVCFVDGSKDEEVVFERLRPDPEPSVDRFATNGLARLDRSD